MHCEECHHGMTLPGLIVAMEQREHFALTRHAEICSDCAARIYRVADHFVHDSRHRFQSVNCAACGSKLPVIRLKFDLRGKGLIQWAICPPCYKRLRDDLLFVSPNVVGFIDKEWETHSEMGAQRIPWPLGTKVRVKHHVPRFHDMIGVVQGFRGLVIPWFGYDVRFDPQHHHFFHERDLEPLATAVREPAATADSQGS